MQRSVSLGNGMRVVEAVGMVRFPSMSAFLTEHFEAVGQ